MNKQKRTEIKENFEKVMDNRDETYSLLKDFEKKHGFVPAKYNEDVKFMAAYAEYRRTGGWRKNPLCLMIVNKATKKAIKSDKKKNLQTGEKINKGLTELEKDTLLRLLKSEKIYKAVNKAAKEVEKMKGVK